MSINEQIAELLTKQTYAERMEMAETFRDYINDWIAEHNTAIDTMDRDHMAFMFEAFIDSFDDGGGDEASTPRSGYSR
jgi:hypothetical protein